MNLHELNDDNAFSKENLFDKEKYNTITISLTQNTEFKEDDVNLIISLMDEGMSREARDEKLKAVKKNNLQNLLIKAVQECESDEDREKILSVCWESGLDFSNYFLFFVEQATSPHYMAAFEALTVATNIENFPDEETRTKALLLIDNSKQINPQIAADLKKFILTEND